MIVCFDVFVMLFLFFEINFCEDPRYRGVWLSVWLFVSVCLFWKGFVLVLKIGV